MFTLSIFIFFFLFTAIAFSGRTEHALVTTQTVQEKLAGQDIFLNYLQMPADAGNTNLDGLVDAASNKNVAQLKDELKTHFDPIYYLYQDGNNWRSWRITIIHPLTGEQTIDGSVPADATAVGRVPTAAQEPLSEVVVPLTEQTVVTIRLSKRGLGAPMQSKSMP